MSRISSLGQEIMQRIVFQFSYPFKTSSMFKTVMLQGIFIIKLFIIRSTSLILKWQSKITPLYTVKL